MSHDIASPLHESKKSDHLGKKEREKRTLTQCSSMPPPTVPRWCLNSLMSLELLDELLSVLHVILVQPGVLLLPIAAPMHQVLSHTVSLSRLQNVLDLILRLALNQLWLWWRLWAPNNCVLVVRCKARDMEHIVDLPSCRKTQAECSI